MAALIRVLIDQYHFYMSKEDHRMDHLPLMTLNPFTVIGFMFLYIYFSNSLGPRLMKDRPPFDCNNAMRIFNAIQILLNGYIVFEAFRLLWIPMRISLICAEVDYSYDPFMLKIAFYTWLYFITKLLDLLDTVFMVLRKKNNQISFLHVYHHTGMAWAGWMAAKFTPGGYCLFFGTVNAFVHTVMYSYYLVTALYPEYKKNIWWKRHITELQLVQFVLVSVHGLVHLLNPSCGFPKLIIALFIPQNIFMFFMFLDFYKKAYLKKKKNEDEDKQS